jgi:hypothetical protein
VTHHVYVGAMPRMARDIATRALAELGYGVLDAPPDPALLRRSQGGTILISSWSGAGLGPYERRLLELLPQAVVIAFDADGRSISRFELWPRRFALGELSAEAIKAAVLAPSDWDERFRD